MELIDKLTGLVAALGFWGWIAVICVGSAGIALISEAVVKIKRMELKHAERMAKIGRGIDPGDEVAAYEKDEV